MFGKQYIVLHHSLTKDSGTVSWGAIRTFHVEQQGWRDIGYHFGIEEVNGQVEVLLGRMLDQTAAAVKEAHMNTIGVHICVVGNFDVDTVPPAVWKKTVELVAFLSALLGIPPTRVKAHRDYASYKSCPGKLFDMDRLRADVAAWKRA